MIARQNAREFYDLISPFLIPRARLAAVTGSKYFYRCSKDCRGAKEVGAKYRLIDTGRFPLSCGHFSDHVQCILSMLVYAGEGLEFCCPMYDAKKCSQEKGFLDSQGEFYLWG